MIKESIIKDKRVKAGLHREEKITTNGAESANHMLKEAAEYEEMSLAEFFCPVQINCKESATGNYSGYIKKRLVTW